MIFFDPLFSDHAVLQRDKKLLGFFLAGEDGIFYPADAGIHGKIVIADSSHVPSPCYVRYAFGGFVPANLYSDAGLPAEPFRTDRFCQY